MTVFAPSFKSYYNPNDIKSVLLLLVHILITVVVFSSLLVSICDCFCAVVRRRSSRTTIQMIHQISIARLHLLVATIVAVFVVASNYVHLCAAIISNQYFFRLSLSRPFFCGYCCDYLFPPAPLHQLPFFRPFSTMLRSSPKIFH